MEDADASGADVGGADVNDDLQATGSAHREQTTALPKGQIEEELSPSTAAGSDGAEARVGRTPEWSRGPWSKKRLIAACSIAGTLIGVLAIAIPVAVTAGDRTTTADTIEVDTQYSSDDGAGLAPGETGEPEVPEIVEPVAAGLSTTVGGAESESMLVPSEWYAVPVDAPWADLWADPSVCSSGGVSGWLDDHGVPMLPQMITSEISNVASAGSSATVRSIRAQGTLTAPPVDTVIVGAMRCVGGISEGVFATMTLGVDPIAVYDDCYSTAAQWPCAGAAEEVPTPGDPVVFDVAPGEIRTLNLSWTQSMDFAGRFVATLAVDGETSTIDLSPEGKALVVPVATRPEARLYFSDGGQWCEASPESRNDECDLDAWLAVLAAG